MAASNSSRGRTRTAASWARCGRRPVPDVLDPRFAFERARVRIDDPYARAVVVIIVDKNGDVDMASRGATSDQELFQIVHHVATGLAEEIIPTLEPSPQMLADARRGRRL